MSNVFAFLLGCVTAFDSPARQTFVSELVVEADLSNAVALKSTSFNLRGIKPSQAFGTGQIRGKVKRTRTEIWIADSRSLSSEAGEGKVAKQIGADPESRKFSAKQSAAG